MTDLADLRRRTLAQPWNYWAGKVAGLVARINELEVELARYRPDLRPEPGEAARQMAEGKRVGVGRLAYPTPPKEPDARPG